MTSSWKVALAQVNNLAKDVTPSIERELDEVIVTLPDSFLSAALDSRASVGTSNAIE